MEIHTHTEALTGHEKSVDIDGNAVSVTPIEHLDPVRGLAAQIGLARVMRASDGDPEDVDPEALSNSIIELLEVCVNEGITSETLHTLRPVQLHRLLDAAWDGALDDV